MNRKKIWLILGPALFALSFIPYGGLTQNVRLALGTVLWMGVWWVAMPVPPAITAFLPVVINAVFALTDMSSITNCYSAELVFLLAGADIITMVWEITGVDKRIAAHSLALVGTSVRQQVVIWFLISTVLSAVLPNTVVAAVLCSIAMAMLKFVGEGDVEKSSAAKLVLLAIVWGANNGGMFTPLGGAMNLITVSYIEELTGAEFLYTDWVRALWPFALAVTVLTLVYLLLLPCKKKTLEGSKTYFSDLCKSLPKLSRTGRISLIVFAAAALLAFTRQLYQRQFPVLKPGFVFLIGGLLMFFLQIGRASCRERAHHHVGARGAEPDVGHVLPLCRRHRARRARQRQRRVGGVCRTDRPVPGTQYVPARPDYRDAQRRPLGCDQQHGLRRCYDPDRDRNCEGPLPAGDPVSLGRDRVI